MVTHNPELAEKYSTRIIRLLDGQVLEDTAPFTAEDEQAEVAEHNEIAEAEEKRYLDEVAEKGGNVKKAKKKLMLRESLESWDWQQRKVTRLFSQLTEQMRLMQSQQSKSF
jgi:ABC-type multidrug transport system ATPase subunit